MKTCTSGMVLLVTIASRWNVLAGEITDTLKVPYLNPPILSDSVRYLFFLPDGARLVAVYDRVIIWDLRRQIPVYVSLPLLTRLETHPIAPPMVVGKLGDILAFSPDGKTVAARKTAKPPGIALLADKDVLTGPAGLCPLFSPTTALEMLASEVAIFDAATSAERVLMEKGVFWDVGPCCFSPDGRTLAGGVVRQSVKVAGDAAGPVNKSYAIVLWDTVNGRAKITFDDLVTGVGCTAFSPDGNLLASGGGGHWEKGSCSELKIWDVRAGKLRLKLAGHGTLPEGEFEPRHRNDAFPSRSSRAGVVTVLAFSPDGRALLSGSGGELKFWDPRDASLIRTVPGVPAGCVRFSPDGKMLAVESNNKILLIETATGAVNRRLAELNQEVNLSWQRVSALEFSPDGAKLAVGYSRGSVAVWDLKQALAVEDRSRPRHRR